MRVLVHGAAGVPSKQDGWGGGAHEDLAGVAVAERKAGVGDEVWQAVSAAEDAGLGVVGEALVGALDGGVERKRRGAALLVLRENSMLACACAIQPLLAQADPARSEAQLQTTADPRCTRARGRVQASYSSHAIDHVPAAAR